MPSWWLRVGFTPLLQLAGPLQALSARFQELAEVWPQGSPQRVPALLVASLGPDPRGAQGQVTCGRVVL